MPIEFQRIDKDGGVTNRAVASWSRGEGGFTASFDVRYRIDKGTFKELSTTATTLEIEGLKPGRTLEVQVRAVGIRIGGTEPKKSRRAKVTAIVPDLSDPVPSVSDLTVSPIDDKQAILTWTPPAAQRLNNLVAVIRHSTKTDGSGTFAGSVKLAEVPVSANAVTVPLLNGEYIIKLKDDVTKKKSSTVVSAVVNIPDATSKRTVLNIREDTTNPPFSSGSSNRGVFYSDVYGGLVLDGDALWDSEISGNIDSFGEIDFIGTRGRSGEYEFSTIVDLGGKFEVTLNKILGNLSLAPDDLINSRTELIDIWPNFDTYEAEETDATLYFRASDEAKTTGTFQLGGSDYFLLEDGSKLRQELPVTFGDWRVLNRNTFVGRTFQFKAVLKSDSDSQTPLINELGVSMSIPARTESSQVIESGAAAKVVTFTNAFYEAPTVGITAFNLGSGDYYEVTSVTRTGFTVHFKDSSNSSVDRDFQYVAAGFGSEQT